MDIQYFRSTANKCLCFRRCELKLHVYVDKDFVGDIDDKRSTTSYWVLLQIVGFSVAENYHFVYN